MENKKIIKGLYEALSSRDLDAVDSFYASDFTEHNPGPGLEPSLEGLKQYLNEFFMAFPDMDFDVQEMVAENDLVAIRGINTGTHQGNFMGIEPTGNRIMVAEQGLFKLADSKITDHWGFFDSFSLFEQIGLIRMEAA